MIASDKKYRSTAIKYKEEEAFSLWFFENQILGNNSSPIFSCSLLFGIVIENI